MSKRVNHIAYRCPDCATVTVGLLGTAEMLGDLVRLKCECGKSALEVKKERDGRIFVGVPCVYCKDEHGFKLSPDILGRGDVTKLSCPFSGMDIAFIGDGEAIKPEIDRSADELSRILMAFEADDVSDIQPHEVGEAECPPDPAIYDTINFVVRDLERAGAIKCPCNSGQYDLRFTDTGMQLYCEVCGASHDFHCMSASVAEEYLYIDEIVLK